MFLLRSLLVVGLVLGLTGFADAAKGKKKKGAGALTGVVKEVQSDKDKPDTGTLTVQGQTKAKKGQPAAPTGDPRKVTINSETKIEKLEGKAKGKKKNKTPVAGTPAKLSDISANSNVAVTLKSGSDVAEKVQIFAAKKGKKKKNS